MISTFFLGLIIFFFTIGQGRSSTVVEVGIEELLGTPLKFKPVPPTNRKQKEKNASEEDSTATLSSTQDMVEKTNINQPRSAATRSSSPIEKISDESVAEQIARYKEFLKDPRRSPGPFDPPDFKKDSEQASLPIQKKNLNPEIREQSITELNQVEPILSYAPQLPPEEAKEWQKALAGLIGQLQDCPLTIRSKKNVNDEISYRIKIAVADDGQTSRSYLEEASGPHKICVDSVLSNLRLPSKKDRVVSEIVLPLNFYQEEM